MYRGLASHGNMYSALPERNPIQPKETNAHPFDQPCGFEGLLIAKPFTKREVRKKAILMITINV